MKRAPDRRFFFFCCSPRCRKMKEHGRALELQGPDMKEIIAEAFELFSKEKDLAAIKIPTGRNSFAEWRALPKAEKEQIADGVWALLRPIVDKDGNGSISAKEFRAFDWPHLMQKVDAAIKVADERRAFEALDDKARAAVLAAEFPRRVARFEAAKKSDFNFFVALADKYKHKHNGTWVVRMRDAILRC